VKDFKADLAKTRFVALYASLTMDYVTINEVRYADYDERYQALPAGQRRELPWSSYVRISEPVEVAFAAIGNDEMIRHAVAALDIEERTVIEELNTKLNSIRERKQQLIAITFQPEVSA
jgi:hypothetical protein